MPFERHPDQPAANGESERYVDPVIEEYKKHVDRTLIRENLRLTVDERLQKLESLLKDAEEMRRAMAASVATRPRQ
jgi:hypothetical protein